MATPPEAGPLFYTFRVRGHDGDGRSSDNPRPKAPRRQRTTFSCEQCQRWKVRCDRQQPCSRCVAGGRGDQCTYPPSSRRPPPSEEGEEQQSQWTPSQHSVSDREPATNRFLFYSRLNDVRSGLTHWTSLVSEFDEARDYIFGAKASFEPAFERLVQLKGLYPTISPHNFPFAPDRGLSRALVVASLPPREVVQVLIDNYMDTFEKTHRLLHPSQFREELVSFWANPQTASSAWMAQLLTMMSLGCRSPPKSMLEQFPILSEEWLSKQYLLCAEASLSRASFMEFPDYASIRALCMMALAKSVAVEMHTTSGGLWALQGLIVRLAMSMSLHRDPDFLFPRLTALEAESRRRIWNTIVLMDLNAAIDSGLTALISPSDWDAAPPSNIDDADLLATDELGDLVPFVEEADTYTDSSLQIVLSRAFAVVSLVLSTVNSPAPRMEYDVVLECDARIRAVLREADGLFAIDSGNCKNISDRRLHVAALQHTMVKVVLRRTLLALHRPFARDLHHAPATSYWSALECSLALLHAHQRLHDRPNDPAPMHWFADLFEGDFAVAMLYVILGLRRQSLGGVSAPGLEAATEASLQLQPGESRTMARDTTWAALKASFEIVKASVGRSFHTFKVFMGISLAIAALEATQTGGDLDEAMESAAAEVILTVRQSRPDHLDAQQTGA